MKKAFTEKPDDKCMACDGEGKVANTDSREPWSMWANLPAGSDIAVKIGTVKPIDCPECGGTGRVKKA